MSCKFWSQIIYTLVHLIICTLRITIYYKWFVCHVNLDCSLYILIHLSYEFEAQLIHISFVDSMKSIMTHLLMSTVFELWFLYFANAAQIILFFKIKETNTYITLIIFWSRSLKTYSTIVTIYAIKTYIGRPKTDASFSNGPASSSQ